jgi:hypothetical protein
MMESEHQGYVEIYRVGGGGGNRGVSQKSSRATLVVKGLSALRKDLLGLDSVERCSKSALFGL